MKEEKVTAAWTVRDGGRGGVPQFLMTRRQNLFIRELFLVALKVSTLGSLHLVPVLLF